MSRKAARKERERPKPKPAKHHQLNCSMLRALLLSVRFHDGRYHGLDTSGRPEWPPSPARLFQALVAGAARGNTLCNRDTDALHWLEELSKGYAPVIAAPSARIGKGLINSVQNNHQVVVR